MNFPTPNFYHNLFFSSPSLFFLYYFHVPFKSSELVRRVREGREGRGEGREEREGEREGERKGVKGEVCILSTSPVGLNIISFSRLFHVYVKMKKFARVISLVN